MVVVGCFFLSATNLNTLNVKKFTLKGIICAIVPGVQTKTLLTEDQPNSTF